MLSRVVTLVTLVTLAATATACDEAHAPVLADGMTLFTDALGGTEAVSQLHDLALTAQGESWARAQGDNPGELRLASTFDVRVEYASVGSRLRLEHERQALYPFAAAKQFTQILGDDVGWLDGDEGFPVLFSQGDIASNKVAAYVLMQELLIPNILLQKVLEGVYSTTELGSTIVDGAAYRQFEVDTGAVTVTLRFDPQEAVLRSATVALHDTLLCDTLTEFIYQDWLEEDGLRVPGRVQIEVDDGVVHQQTHGDVVVNPVIDPARFELPPEASDVADPNLAELGQQRALSHHMFSAMGVPFPLPQDDIDAVELAPGVHFLVATHNSLVIEQAQGVVVVEAPLERERSAAVAEWIAGVYPDKPVSFVVNTHHHADHAGGLRHWVAQGAEIVVGEAAEDFFNDRVFGASCAVLPDALAMTPVEAELEVVPDGGSWLADDPATPVQVFHVETNHAADMLMVYLPNQGILFNSDLYNPLPIELVELGFAPYFEPSLAVDLADAIDQRGLGPSFIAGGHGQVATFQQFVVDIDASQ